MKARQPQDFSLLGQQGNKAVLDWVMKEGLIPSRYECPKCKKDMRLVERKGTIDGFEKIRSNEHKMIDANFKDYLKAIARVYPPHESDDQKK
ncbi:hypothetical protein TNCV_358981 [Trichonephila clavipes]|nr:hypothetical protein TNCV_358981 [Trichonephila clavipes]